VGAYFLSIPNLIKSNGKDPFNWIVGVGFNQASLIMACIGLGGALVKM